VFRVARLDLSPRALRAFVDIHDFVLTDLNNIAVVQVVAPHAFGLHVYAVGAVEIFDETGIGLSDYLAVMPADEFAVDL
jgi:hypothetical protein